MRLDVILIVAGGFMMAGILLGWLTLWPSFRRMAQDLRMRDWNLTHLQQAHTEQNTLFQTLMVNGAQVVVRLDAQGQLAYVSPSCQAVLGYSPADIRRRTEIDLLVPTRNGRLSVRHGDGHAMVLNVRTEPLPDGGGTTLVLTDITNHAMTEALLAEARGKLRQRASRDTLTNLANRAYFLTTLDQALTNGQDVAVLLLDLDRFGPLKDRYGHETTDRMLLEVAARVTIAMAKEVLVARLGDDDFAVLLRSPDGDANIAARARDLIRVLNVPIPTGGLSVSVGGSIGIAVGPRDAISASRLLRAADIAMMHAREAGGGTYKFFEAPMADSLARMDELRRDLPAAIGSGAIVPYFQPLVRLADNAIVGFEVLARWPHPSLGILGPAEFLPLVEEAGLSATIFESVVMRACRAARKWPAHICLAVNMSPIELQDTSLPDTMRDILLSTGFPGERLEVEITENALVHDARIARGVLDRLRAQGLRVALDDFGTGYSSLYHLRELPFDKVKIDGSFMRDLGTDADAARYIAAMVDFGLALGLELTAEGIENSATADRLRDLGCTYGQGYYLGSPMSAEEADQLMGVGVPAEMADV